MKISAAPNFRDFGGLPTEDGRQIRRARLYRSDALDSLLDSDHDLLGPLGVKIICDLRSVRERADAPNRLPPRWAAEILTAAESAGIDSADIARAFGNDRYADPTRGRDYMMRTYGGFPAQFAAILRALFTHLSEGRAPVLVHCAAGKDRTGFVCAMVQLALGVTPDAVRADYILSDAFFGADRIAIMVEQRLGLTPTKTMLDPMRVHPEYLNCSIDRLIRDYGSIDRYLEQQAGMTPTLRELLRSQLLEDADAPSAV